MFSICQQTRIVGLENTKCSIAHIQQCISDINKHESVLYTYAGPKVQRGIMLLHTCKGDFTIKFDVENAWARKLEIY